MYDTHLRSHVKKRELLPHRPGYFNLVSLALVNTLRSLYIYCFVELLQVRSFNIPVAGEGN